MLFYGAVRRFTARLLHVFKTEKAYPTAVSVLEVYVAFVLFSFFFPTVVLLGSSPGSTTRELSIFPCFTALVEAQAPILPRHWRAYAHGKDLLLFLPLEQTRRLPACPPALCGGPCWEPPRLQPTCSALPSPSRRGLAVPLLEGDVLLVQKLAFTARQPAEGNCCAVSNKVLRKEVALQTYGGIGSCDFLEHFYIAPGLSHQPFSKH